MSLKVITKSLIAQGGVSVETLQSVGSPQTNLFNGAPHASQELAHLSRPGRISGCMTHTASGFAAATLNRERDEDGPPLACSYRLDDFKMRIGFVSVADGLGGAGKRRVKVEHGDQWQKRTMAYVAARTAQEAARRLLRLRPDLLAGSLDSVRESLIASLRHSFSEIKFKELWFEFKKERHKDFPTTFSAAVIQEADDKKRVFLLWVGDSPLFIFTPDRIVTTHQPEHDFSYAGDCVKLGHYGLRVQELEFTPDTPLLVVAASDGLVKFKNLSLAHHFLLDAVQSYGPQKISQVLAKRYQHHKQRGHVIPDDATVAMISSSRVGEIQSLTANAPLQVIK